MNPKIQVNTTPKLTTPTAIAVREPNQDSNRDKDFTGVPHKFFSVSQPIVVKKLLKSNPQGIQTEAVGGKIGKQANPLIRVFYDPKIFTEQEMETQLKEATRKVFS